jgi:hypothetical protein
MVSWWGELAALQVAKSAPSARAVVAQQASNEVEPTYGIGGFHQMLPDGGSLATPASLTIHYDPREVSAAAESTLGLYYWDSATTTWRHVPAQVDAANRTVSANITAFHIYTLAPALPSGRFDLAITPTTLAPGATAHVKSGPIHFNNGTTVPDGTQFTIVAISGATIAVEDVNAGAEGIQVASRNGIVEFDVTAGQAETDAKLEVRSVRGSAYGQATISIRKPTDTPPDTGGDGGPTQPSGEGGDSQSGAGTPQEDQTVTGCGVGLCGVGSAGMMPLMLLGVIIMKLDLLRRRRMNP